MPVMISREDMKLIIERQKSKSPSDETEKDENHGLVIDKRIISQS